MGASLKQCPKCGSISSNTQTVCDMCGAILTDVLSRTMDEIEQERSSEEKRSNAFERQTVRRAAERSFLAGVPIFAVACGLVIGGLWFMFNSTNSLTLALAVFMLIFGFILLQVALRLPEPITRWRGRVARFIAL